NEILSIFLKEEDVGTMLLQSKPFNKRKDNVKNAISILSLINKTNFNEKERTQIEIAVMPHLFGFAEFRF
ncbi:MAG: hypothetical protein K2I15_08580, partial [Bacteroides sp.]|nr:hypothetical protein [Bacteroides sp.]